MITSKDIINKVLELGGNDCGFFVDEGADMPYKNGISVVVALSDAIVDEITDRPTHTYFNHYRTVNAHIDNILLRLGMFLQENSYNYITVASSQSINDGNKYYEGRYSHKKGATLAKLGGIGKSALFIHKKYGTRVRLGTIFTDFIGEVSNEEVEDLCNGCNLCVRKCPAMAIIGGDFSPKSGRDNLLDPKACSEYMKNNFQRIGRGSVCGVCVKVCKKRNKNG